MKMNRLLDPSLTKGGWALTVLEEALAALESEFVSSGTAHLRRRSEYLERSFSHMLDHGGLRWATLRGCEKPTKRHYVAAMACNLSLLMRKLPPQPSPRCARP
jgi:hypothetical protein